MKLLIATSSLAIMMSVAPGFAQTAKQDMKAAGQDSKDAAKNVGRATKHSAKTAKRKTKHAVHKATQ
jgi:hypothetical protein